VRLCAVSVDLDEIPFYFQIYGLSAPSGPAAGAVYDVALTRLLDLARAVEIPLTLFAIGADLMRPEAAAKLRAARAAGHEIANHSQDHRYDLTRLGYAEIVGQIDGGAEAIATAIGARPTGFRAPGYTVTDLLFSALAELGVEYDSSVFPSPAYYGLKALARLGIALQGRRSRSILDTPRVLVAPTRPYRVGKPYWKRGSGLLELPVQVTRGARLPFIGTTLTMAGPWRARVLARMCVGEPLVNLELHGIDVLDSSDGLYDLARHQRDLSVPLAQKLDSLVGVVELFKRSGYSFVTLREAAAAFA
jgi:peptidoglycan/xylan/chitin deacetylase (PgdA/CDA1 family)